MSAIETSGISRRGLGALAVGAGAASLAACDNKDAGGAAGGELVFSILSAESAQNMGPLWQPLLDDLAKQTGLKIKPFFASNYTALVEAMRFNQVQIGWFSALPAVEAVDRASGMVIGRVISGDGSMGYNSVLIVKKGSGITKEKVLKCDKSLNFGIGDARSTSGTLAPEFYLFAPAGIDPAACFKTVRSANHQNNLQSVVAGVLDVATNNTEGLLFARREGQKRGETVTVADKVDIIWTSPPLPESGIVVRKDLDKAVVEKLRSFFLSYGTAPGAEGDRQREVMKGLTYRGFAAADDSYLLPVRGMLAFNELADAKKGGDPAKIAAAQKKYDELKAKVDALTPPSPAAQPAP